MDRVVRVLIVDDSAYVRKVVKQMLSRSPFIEVVGTARDGDEALEMVAELQPDVVTLDLMMPNMDGVAFLREQMKRDPIPVIVVSIANDGAELALQALDAGAIDFVQKPTALATEKVYEMSDELIQKVKAAAQVPMSHITEIKTSPMMVSPPAITLSHPQSIDIIVLGISTGGPQALSFLLPQLPENLPVPLAIVLHMPVGYTEMFAHRLNEISLLQVVEAGHGDRLRPGMVFIAPAGRHLKLVRQVDGSVVTHLDALPFDTLHRPAVDVLFRSAAEVFSDRVLGIVMTGMGADGKQGAAWIKARGGLIFTEAEETCIVYGMPRSVVEAGLSDQVVPLHQMATAILEAL